MSRAVAIVPVKPFEEGKSRLNAVLRPSERAQLNREFFGRTLAELAVFPGAAQTIVVSRSEAVLDQARRAGMVTVIEAGNTLNGALSVASEVARRRGATTLFVVPTDLPLIDASLLERIVSTASYEKLTCTLAPDEARQGTNLMVVTPPDDTIFQFGERSFEKHQLLAKSRGYSVRVVDDARLAFDVDEPPDYERWIALGATKSRPCGFRSDSTAKLSSSIEATSQCGLR